ncbi:MAG: M15 family metallopeptidase [Leptospiraceae bacterium]|nr:M15 family metallopeptidase [Leptospiraceae bacterium]MDW8305806.1 M15 family metallopeptidase [Leptospiraceae bacterium]
MRVFLRGGIFFFLSLASSSSQSENDDLLLAQGFYDPSRQQGYTLLKKEQAVSYPLYLHQDTESAFEAMRLEAKKKGIQLRIISATRSFEQQRKIWESKYTKLKQNSPHLEEEEIVKKILRYSAPPGASRHHWGSDIDITFGNILPQNALENESWKKGEGKRVYEWLNQNAPRFGFCQPYRGSPQNRRPGYSEGHEEESWHWSYKARALSFMRLFETKFPIRGDFSGKKHVQKYVREYFFNVHPDCLD